MTKQQKIEWLESLRDFLYRLALTNGATGQDAEVLGQWIPEMIKSVDGE